MFEAGPDAQLVGRSAEVDSKLNYMASFYRTGEHLDHGPFVPGSLEERNLFEYEDEA